MLSKFWKMFQFENRVRDELAHYFSITDGFLWRRDVTRMVVCYLSNVNQGHYDYDYRPLHKADIKTFSIQPDMKIEVSTSEGNIILEPQKKTLPNTLKFILRKNQEFNTEMKMDANELKRILLVCEQKWMMEKEEDPKIIFDLKNNQILMKDREEQFDIPILEEKKKNSNEITYSFHLLKDMVYNKYKEDIFFRFSDYYTVIEYEKNIYSSIMHVG